MTPALILSSDSHVFEPPDLWTTRIDRAFRDRAPRMNGSMAPISSWSRRTRSSPGSGSSPMRGLGSRLPRPSPGSVGSRTCLRAGTTPISTWRTCASTGWPARCCTRRRASSTSRWPIRAHVGDLPRLQRLARRLLQRGPGPAQGHRDDQPGRCRGGTKELERAARRGFAGAMITEYPLEHRRYDQPEYEPFWAAAEALDMPLSLHTATRRQGKIRGAGERRSATRQPVDEGLLSRPLDVRPDLLRRLRALSPPPDGIVEFELAWAPHVLSAMDYTYRERHEEALPVQGRHGPATSSTATSS